jgi:hypothetical protein
MLAAAAAHSAPVRTCETVLEATFSVANSNDATSEFLHLNNICVFLLVFHIFIFAFSQEASPAAQGPAGRVSGVGSDAFISICFLFSCLHQSS